jgi:hypothetical protein
LLRHLGPQEFQVVLEGALPATRVGLCGTAPAAAPPLPEFFDKRTADTKALGNRPLRFCSGFQRCDDPVTQVLRVGFHAQDYTGNGPYKQLQLALGGSLAVSAFPRYVPV